MNKADLITAISEKLDFSKKDSEIALKAIVSAIEEALASGEKVLLTGFGTFEVKKRAQRAGRNPQTKEEIIIPASSAPVFRAGKVLKDNVNK